MNLRMVRTNVRGGPRVIPSMAKETTEERSPQAGRRPRDFPHADGVDLVATGFTETRRQREVLDAVVQGLENKEIAQSLGIGEQRVKELVSCLLKKFEVPSRAALARVAINMRILGSDTRGSVPYSYLFDESPVCIAITEGPEHCYVLVNSAYVQTFGDRDYVGHTARECFPCEPANAHAERDQVFTQGTRYEESEAVRSFVMPEGGRREFILTFIIEPIRSASNEITGLAYYGWDVTDVVAKRLAQQEPRPARPKRPVGSTGLEPVTSAMSTLRSNQLS